MARQSFETAAIIIGLHWPTELLPTSWRIPYVSTDSYRTALMSASSTKPSHIDWLDPIKALALLGILLNHVVEEFGPGPWFTNPSNDWPDFRTRMSQVFPSEHGFPISFIQFIGWLGDSGPGVFILASGLGLTWAIIHRPRSRNWIIEFYQHRLLRIFPLFIAMHFVILGSSLFIPGSNLSLADRNTLLSMLGLRFTGDLFFYIAPAWWFVWLILQLYVVFPFLVLLLERVGVQRFLLITCMVTFCSRALGVLYSPILYYWMTGIFFGTRLAEFAVGMALAVILRRWAMKGFPILHTRTVLGWASLAYVLGLLLSFTYPGAIFSNLFVTVGLSGLFYVLWKGCITKSLFLSKAVTWVGLHSYGVYLFHHAPLTWTGTLFPGSTGSHIFAALAIVLVSFPVGWFMNYAISRLAKTLKDLQPFVFLRTLAVSGSLAVILALVWIEPQLWSPWKYRTFAWLLGISILALGAGEYVIGRVDAWLERLIRWTAIFSAVVQMFLLPPRFGAAAIVVGLSVALLSVVIAHFLTVRPLAWSAGLLGALTIFSLLEIGLRHSIPLEAGQWGELPALQTHPTRVYSLKPNQTTHLRYNNYDYMVRTNSLGLVGPEISPEKPTGDTLRILVIGDAFTMPEGVAWEKSYPVLLENQLAQCLAPRPVQVINAGVTGYGPVEELAQLRELIPLLKPDIVIYEFFVNEFKEVNFSPEQRLTEIGLQPTDHSLVLAFLRQSQVLAQGRRFRAFLTEQITDAPAEWRYAKALLEYYRAGENVLYSEETIKKLGSYLGAMAKVAQDGHSRLVIFFVPAAVAVSRPSELEYFPWGEDLHDLTRYDLNRPFRSLQRLAQDLDVPAIDLTPYVQSTLPQPVYFRESWHWNEEGHRVASRAMVESLSRAGYVDRSCLQARTESGSPHEVIS